MHLTLFPQVSLLLLFLGLLPTEARATAPDSALQQANAFYRAGTFDSAAMFYRIAMKSEPFTVDDRFDAAGAFAQTGAAKEAIGQLVSLCFRKGYILYPHLLLEPKFRTLWNHSEWHVLVNEAHMKRNGADPATETGLRDRLDTIFMQDQLPRLELNAALSRLPPQDPALQQLGREMARADSQTLAFVIPLLNERGWLPVRNIGHSGVKAVFMVLQHADSATQLHWLPTLRAARDRAEIPDADMALFEDRTALRSGKMQIYGTQVYADGITGIWTLEPLEDPLHVDERRRRAGLAPLGEYLRNWDIIWDAATYEKAQKAKHAK